MICPRKNNVWCLLLQIIICGKVYLSGIKIDFVIIIASLHSQFFVLLYSYSTENKQRFASWEQHIFYALKVK